MKKPENKSLNLRGDFYNILSDSYSMYITTKLIEIDQIRDSGLPWETKFYAALAKLRLLLHD